MEIADRVGWSQRAMIGRTQGTLQYVLQYASLLFLIEIHCRSQNTAMDHTRRSSTSNNGTVHRAVWAWMRLLSWT